MSFFQVGEGKTNVLKKITSLFQHCSFSVSVTLTVAYWVLLRTELEKPRNWHTHGINMLLVFVDVIVTDIPGNSLQEIFRNTVFLVKMAHLMYTLAVCWAYLSMTLIVYYNSSNPKHLEIYADTLGTDLSSI